MNGAVQEERWCAKRDGRLPAWTSMRAVAAELLDRPERYAGSLAPGVDAAWDLGEQHQSWRPWTGWKTPQDLRFTMPAPVMEATLEDTALWLLFVAAALEAGDLEVGYVG